MTRACGTRALKNARRIQQLAPHIIPAKEPAEGFVSLVPRPVLANIHRMSDQQLATSLRGHPHLQDLVEVARQMRAPLAPPQVIARAPSYDVTLYFVQVTYLVGASKAERAFDPAAVATAIQYAIHAVRPISAYCSQYVANRIEVAQSYLRLRAPIPVPSFNDADVQRWVNGIIQDNRLSKDSSYIVLLNHPSLAVNTDGDPNHDTAGYHSKADAPYSFVNVAGDTMPVLTIDDKSEVYADTLSHEIAEMICDPAVLDGSPEVCDGCAANCKNAWDNFFIEPSPSLANSYVGSFQTSPFTISFLHFTYYIASIALPAHVHECPPNIDACKYPPPRPTGISQLLFYDRQAGVGEFYAVTDPGSIDIQFSNSKWRTSWSKIVPGTFAPGNHPGPDLLFYAPADRTGEFDRTDGRGDISFLGASNDWRNDWSIIVPGKFSDGPYTDLLFYEPGSGTGEFWRTDGRGNVSLIGGNYDWRKDWSIIVPGKFSSGPYTDLLFYAPGTGTGEFWRADGRGHVSLIGGNDDWRKDWSIIVPGKFSDGPYTDLLFYEPSTGTGEFWRADGHGNVSLIGGNYDWRKDWKIIVPGKFSSGKYTDLLFYEPSTGTGEFWSTDGQGHVRRIGAYTNWRTTWDIILQVQ
jgi:hypothetical protein